MLGANYKYYDCNIQHHPGKANVVVDALNRKSQCEATATMLTQTQLIQEFKKLNIDVTPNEDLAFVATLVIQPLTKDRVREAQGKDPMLVELKEKDKYGETPNFHITMNDVMKTNNWLCVKEITQKKLIK